MILTYTAVLGDGERHTVNATVTTDHPSSSYGQPVVILADGEPIDSISWMLMQYSIQQCSQEEYDLLQRTPFFTPGWGPGAHALAAARPTPKRRRIYLTLPDSEIDVLREIGGGSVSAGVSRLLAERGQ